MAVQRLMEIRTKDYFIWAAGLGLHCLHCPLELRVTEDISGSSSSCQTPFGFELLAAVNQLQGLSIPNRKLSVSKSKRCPKYLHGGFHQLLVEGYELWLSLSSTRT